MAERDAFKTIVRRLMPPIATLVTIAKCATCAATIPRCDARDEQAHHCLRSMDHPGEHLYVTYKAMKED